MSYTLVLNSSNVINGTNNNTYQYKFILGSDGLFDMTMLDKENDIVILREKNGHEIVAWCMDRWLQEWNGNVPEKGIHTFHYKKEDCDDISVATIDVCPNT
jgi:hypothetical protein